MVWPGSSKTPRPNAPPQHQSACQIQRHGGQPCVTTIVPAADRGRVAGSSAEGRGFAGILDALEPTAGAALKPDLRQKLAEAEAVGGVKHLLEVWDGVGVGRGRAGGGPVLAG